MSIHDIMIRGLKTLYRTIFHKQFLAPECDCDRQSSNDKIYDLLATSKPCFISRFGTTEINCINNYLCISNSQDSFTKRVWNYISDKTHTPWWNTNHFVTMVKYSGIYPPSKQTATRFSKLMIDDIPLIDLLGCHQYYEKFMPLRSDVIRVQLEMLYPFFVERPWTRILKGKRVLVVHPFANTISKQYNVKKQLFNNIEILPDFTLITFPSVQSLGGSSEFNSWFDALEYMKQEIEKIDFDICLLGCGAYGMPLGAFIKRIGKQAVHIGGGLQLLFGIKGNRWESGAYTNYWHYRPGIDISIDYRTLFNDYWVRPSKEEKPQSAKNVENECYW